MEDFAETLPGYTVRRALGSGSAGSVWLARDLASGRLVVVKRVPVVAAPERFRRDLAVVQGLDHLHIARLLEVRQVDREWVLVSEFGAAGSLASLVQRRGELSLGELVTLIGPVAQAVAAAHRAGLTHSHLGPGDVVLTADGRPLVTDLGLRSTTGERDVAADLTDLAELAVLAGGSPRVFSANLLDADAATVAQRVLALADPEPIDLALGNDSSAAPPADPAPPRHEPGRRASRPVAWRGLLAPVSAATVVVLALAVLVISRLDTHPTTVDSPIPPSATNRPPSAPPSPDPSSPPVAPTGRPTGVQRAPVASWLATLRALDVRRSHAFATVDAHELDTVYVPGSGPWRSDRSVLASYRSRGLRVLDVRIHIDRVRIIRSDQHQVVLHVVDHLVNGTVVDGSGRRIRLPSGPLISRLIALTRPSKSTPWRITRITAT